MAFPTRYNLGQVRVALIPLAPAPATFPTCDLRPSVGGHDASHLVMSRRTCNQHSLSTIAISSDGRPFVASTVIIVPKSGVDGAWRESRIVSLGGCFGDAAAADSAGSRVDISAEQFRPRTWHLKR